MGKFTKRKHSAVQRQKGFSLVELVITVIILGILSSMAIPAYRDYTIRTKVAEASSIFKSVKTAYAVHFSVNGELPNNLNQVKNLSNSRTTFAGDYIRWMQIQPNGRVRARTKNIAELGPAANKIMEFRPVIAASNKSINWTVFSRANRDNWVDPKYLPAL